MHRPDRPLTLLSLSSGCYFCIGPEKFLHLQGCIQKPPIAPRYQLQFHIRVNVPPILTDRLGGEIPLTSFILFYIKYPQMPQIQPNLTATKANRLIPQRGLSYSDY
jgi:hypothetical protein